LFADKVESILTKEDGHEATDFAQCLHWNNGIMRHFGALLKLPCEVV
jgi:hypothetical protein